jgi:hypothetical protein
MPAFARRPSINNVYKLYELVQEGEEASRRSESKKQVEEEEEEEEEASRKSCSYTSEAPSATFDFPLWCKCAKLYCDFMLPCFADNLIHLVALRG